MSVVVRVVRVDAILAMFTELCICRRVVSQMDYVHVFFPNLVANQRDVDAQRLKQL